MNAPQVVNRPSAAAPASNGFAQRAVRAARYAWGQVQRRVRVPVTITDPPTDVLVDWNVAVPMRDGVLLRINVFRPASGGQHPVLLSAHPYGKDALSKRRRFRDGYGGSMQYHMMQSGPVTHSAWTSWEAPDPAYWVSRGYVVVNADLRGWGQSDGVGELFSEQEGLDCHDLIEWVAVQPWSTGRVGMTGVSYLAISQWAAAATRPPHLAAICPWEGFTDFYRDCARPGGVRENGFLTVFSIGLRIAAHRSAGVIAQSKRRPDFDEWWAKKNRAIENIEVPTLVCGSFSDHNLHTRGSFDGFRRISSPDKWLYTHRGPKWTVYYSTAGLQAQSDFFDHFLRGQRTAILDTPPVRVEVRDDAETVTAVRYTSSWPPPDTDWRELHLHADNGTLQSVAPAAAADCSFDIRRGHLDFSYHFDVDTEIVGPMLLTVPIAVTGTDDVAVFAGIRKFRQGREIPFLGSYGFPFDLVTHGMLVASHRRVDVERSLPYQPFHPFTRPEPLTQGQRVELQIELLPSATLFRAGDEMRLDLRGRWFFSRNPLVGQFPPAYAPTARKGICTVHTGGSQRAVLTVPIAQSVDRA
jgi:predicted acyl esterase